jgi:hypothetical protein
MITSDKLSQNATLSGPHQTAMDALLAGKNITAAAQAAGVDRTTLHRWLRDDPDFVAIYNARRRDLAASAQGRLLATVEAATATVEKAIADGDVQTALTLLKALGVLAPVSIGSDDRDAVSKEQMLRSLEGIM